MHYCSRETELDEVRTTYGPAIGRVVASYAPPGADREDLAQEVAMALVRALPAFRGDASLKTYVLRIAPKATVDKLESASMIRTRAARLLVGLSVGVAVAVAGYIGVSMVVADRLTKPYRRPLASSPAALGLTHEDVTFSSTVDDTTLRGWFLPAEDSDRAVLVVHGRSSSRTGDNGELVAQGAALVDGGYNVLLFDFRAHGLSDGMRYTLGADEQGDVLGAVAYLESRGFAAERLGFWAHSMGAATVLLAAGASPDVRNIVADSSFARLEDLLARELPRESGLPGFFNPAILYFGRERFGLDTRVLNPVEAVAGLPPRSLFVVHAEADRLIPVDHARRIAAAAGPAVWDLWIFPGASHDRVWSAAPELYRSRVLAFFDERLD